MSVQLVAQPNEVGIFSRMLFKSAAEILKSLSHF
jgi:hypothetical protein